MKTNLTFTVGMPTCYGGESLLTTAKSLLASQGVAKFRFIIVADRTPIAQHILQELKRMGIEIYWNEQAGSQFKKLKKMITMIDSDIFIITQDDITFEPDTLAKIVSTFAENPKTTFVTTRVLPLQPLTLFESIMCVEPRIHDRITRLWNNSQNYYASSGRCIAFRTSFIKKFRIPNSVVNGDTFLYFENKRLKGRLFHQVKAIVYIRSPQRLKDQIGPSSRFQYSQKEMEKKFKFDLSSQYHIPMAVLLKSILSELFSHPLHTLAFMAVHLYTRIKKQPLSKVSNPAWEVDISTKKLARL